MLGTIFSLLGLAAYAVYDTANTHKKAKQICQEKGWGDCRNPRSNENLQWTYFTYYVELKQSYKLFQQHLKRKDLKTDIKYDISYIIDPETGLWKKIKTGSLFPQQDVIDIIWQFGTLRNSDTCGTDVMTRLILVSMKTINKSGNAV